MAMGIFQQLDWLTTRVKRLCCAVEQIQQSGAGSYKVYTALLTQSGGQNTDALEGGNLTIGVTYKIQGVGGGADFTNVGAPNNDIDTWFVATGTTPNSWGTGGSLSYDLGAPVVTVLENTIGNIWWTYANVGVYAINSNSLFTYGKTFLINGPFNNLNTSGYTISFEPQYTNAIYFAISNIAGNNADGIGSDFSIEIRVYN